MTLKAFYLIDFMGSAGKEPEQEVADTMKAFADLGLPVELSGWSYSFDDIENYPFIDIVILDYGGVLPGADDMVRGQLRAAWQWAEEHPSKLMIVYSLYTWRMYSDEMNEAFGELANVVCAFADMHYSDVVLKWFNVTSTLTVHDKLIVPSRKRIS